MATVQTANPYLDENGLPKGGTATPWVGTQAQVDDSVANHVAALTSKDSKMNQMARTEGLKLANSRGMLNSSMGIGAAQDAVIRNALPIAAQDAGQAFQKNQLARGFEYGMEDKSRANAFTSGERLGGQEFQSAENTAARGWQTAENIAQRGFLGTQADLDRDLQLTLQDNQISAAEELQIRQIASTEGIEAANRRLQTTLQENDIAFRMKEGNLDRASAERMQKLDIESDKVIAKLSRDLQEKIASWNVKSTDKLAAAQYVTNVGAQYTADIDSINANTNLSAAARTTALTAAKNRQSTRLNLGEQLFSIDLKWAT